MRTDPRRTDTRTEKRSLHLILENAFCLPQLSNSLIAIFSERNCSAISLDGAFAWILQPDTSVLPQVCCRR